MKARLHVICAAVIAASMAVGAQAASPAQTRIDSLKTSHKVFTFGEGEVQQDSIQKAIDRFYYDQFRSAQQPDAPNFLMMSKDGKVAMGIGGNLTARGWFNWGKTGFDPSDGFITSEIPMTADPANKHSLNGSVNGTRLFFRVIGNHSKVGLWQVYIGAKFNGGPSGMAFKLNNAYATVGDWTIGYAPSTFEDIAAWPFTVDEQGPNAEIFNTNVLVRWMHNVNKNWVVAASAEFPNNEDAAATSTYAPASAYLPNIAAFVQYQWEEQQHIRLSGIMRFMPYRDLVKSENRTVAGWGVQGSTVFRPWLGPVTVYMTATYGKGIASLTNDLYGLNLDLIGDNAVAGHMKAPATFGATAGVQYNFSPSVFATAAVSELRFLPDEAVSSSTYRYGMYGAFNVCWNVTSRLMVGAEVDLGALRTFAMDTQWAHRAGLMAQLSF